MPRVIFAPAIQRHVPCDDFCVSASTVGEVLEAVFLQNTKLRSYVVDDQQRLRKHVTVFIDGIQLADRIGLTDTTDENSEVYVVQALSGG